MCDPPPLPSPPNRLACRDQHFFLYHYHLRLHREILHTMADVEYIKSLFNFHPDWPKKGITFCDILPALRDPTAFEALITHLLNHIFAEVIPKLSAGPDGKKRIDAVVGLDARGFLLAPILALRLNAAFVPVRKSGKLPGSVEAATYMKEYGEVRMISHPFPAESAAVSSRCTRVRS